MASNRGKSNSRNTNRKKSSSRKKQTNREETLDFVVRSEISLICFLVLAIFLFICNFRVCGAFGNVLSDVMFGLFGITAYIMPVACFVAIGLIISNGGSAAAIRRIVAGLILIIVAGIGA